MASLASLERSKKDPAQEVELLRDELRRNEHHYYDAARPEISDAENDAKMRRLM